MNERQASIQALEEKANQGEKRIEELRATLRDLLIRKENTESSLRGIEAEISDYQNAVKLQQDRVDEFRWAVRLIERNTTVDQAFMNEVWSDDGEK